MYWFKSNLLVKFCATNNAELLDFVFNSAILKMDPVFILYFILFWNKSMSNHLRPNNIYNSVMLLCNCWFTVCLKAEVCNVVNKFGDGCYCFFFKLYLRKLLGKKDASRNKVIGQLLLLVFWSEWFVVIGLQMCKRSSWTRHLIMIILPSRVTFTARVKSGPEQHQQTLIQCTHTDEMKGFEIWRLILKHCWALFWLVSD